MSIGMMAAAVQLAIQKGSAVLWLFSSGAWLTTGALFPLTALPGPVRTIAQWIPIVHAAQHAWTQLSWLCDIAHLARSEAIDWDELVCRARKLGVEWIIAVTFSLAKRLLGTPKPPLIKTDHHAEKFAASVIPIIVGRTKINPDSPRYFRLMMDTRERRRDRARFLWRLAFTPGVGEWSAIKLPDPLFAFYGLVRVFRLAQRVA